MVYDMIPEDASSKSSMARTDLRHTKSGYVKQERASNKRDSCIARRRTGSIEFVHLINAYAKFVIKSKEATTRREDLTFVKPDSGVVYIPTKRVSRGENGAAKAVALFRKGHGSKACAKVGFRS